MHQLWTQQIFFEKNCVKVHKYNQQTSQTNLLSHQILHTWQCLRLISQELVFSNDEVTQANNVNTAAVFYEVFL